MSQTNAAPYLKAILKHLEDRLALQPELAYSAYNSILDIIRTSGENAPAVTIVPETYTDEEGAVDAQVINPRTGEVDTLISVDVGHRQTDLDEYGINAENSSIHIEYDSGGHYDGLLYLTASDQLPVSLPEGWTEV